MLQIAVERESIKVLEECKALQIKKSNDYQNPLSTVKQADHYPHGIQTILDMIHQKSLRAKSLIETSQHNSSIAPNFESIEDTLKDMINYLSFAVSFIRGKMDGQDPNRDMFNRRIQPPQDLAVPEIKREQYVKTSNGWGLKCAGPIGYKPGEVSVIMAGEVIGKRDPMAIALERVIAKDSDQLNSGSLAERTQNILEALTDLTDNEQIGEPPMHRVELDPNTGEMITTPILRSVS